MKALFLIALMVAGHCSRANMASPIIEGTRTSTAFSSKDIDILSESISIVIDSSFSTAKYVVEYTIKNDMPGRQIPLLFFAQDYKDEFRVSVDGLPVQVQDIPVQYARAANSPYAAFSGSFKARGPGDGQDEVAIQWEQGHSVVQRLDDLKYFETYLSAGIHKIRVAYTAEAWTDMRGWVRTYSFRYSLTPAKYWKSFGSLSISVRQEGAVKQLTTNIGKPKEQDYQQTNTWTFSKLPEEYLEFSYKPEVTGPAKPLLAVGPSGLALIAGIILVTLHVLCIRWYRRKNVQVKYSPAMILGSIAIPLIVLLTYIYAHYFIDHLIGEHAGLHHGYVFLTIVLYPFVLPVYWVFMWLTDEHYKKKYAAGVA